MATNMLKLITEINFDINTLELRFGFDENLTDHLKLLYYFRYWKVGIWIRTNRDCNR